jgi:hypothetical protein
VGVALLAHLGRKNNHGEFMAILDNGTTMMFFNVCWHKYYKGPLPDDKIDSKHGYFDKFGNEWGEECYTFLPDENGKLYFHGPVFEDSKIEINNLNPQNNDIFVDDVFIIFISTEPVSDNQYIVGWYKQARVFREFQKYHDSTRQNQQGGTWYYNVTTDVQHGFCVEVKDRRGFSLSDMPKFRRTWYANDYRKFCKNVYEYTIRCEQERKNERSGPQVKVRRPSEKQTPPQSGGGAGRYNQNVEERLLIEKISMDKAMRFYEEQFYDVINVDVLAKGWDLEASKDGKTLKIEVKGTKGDQIYFGLTPNEYKKLKECVLEYRIAVVTECLSEEPILTIFNIRQNDDAFEGYNGNTILSLVERPGAIGSISKIDVP